MVGRRIFARAWWATVNEKCSGINKDNKKDNNVETVMTRTWNNNRKKEKIRRKKITTHTQYLPH